jgi:hypothetical protein
VRGGGASRTAAGWVSQGAQFFSWSDRGGLGEMGIGPTAAFNGHELRLLHGAVDCAGVLTVDPSGGPVF